MSTTSLESLGFSAQPIRVEPVMGYPVYTDGDSYVPVAHVFDDAPNALEYARLFTAAPAMLEALEAVMYFWGRDPLAFGDEATINSLAGRFAAVADQCRLARDAAIGVES